jgi:hypothetical protein
MKIKDKSAMTTVEIKFIRWLPKMCVKGMNKAILEELKAAYALAEMLEHRRKLVGYIDRIRKQAHRTNCGGEIKSSH